MKKTDIIVLVVLVAILTILLPSVLREHPPKVHAASTFGPISCDNWKSVSITSNTQIVTTGATQFIYLCSLSFGSIGGSSFSIVEGTGTTCATNTAAVAGGTTAATGYGLAANGNMNSGSGTGAIAKTAVAGDNVCIYPTGTGPLAGVVGWTSQPF